MARATCMASVTSLTYQHLCQVSPVLDAHLLRHASSRCVVNTFMSLTPSFMGDQLLDPDIDLEDYFD